MHTNLTKTENRIMQLISQGKSNKEILDILCISFYTFKTHLHHIYKKYELLDDKEYKKLKAVLIYQKKIIQKILDKCNELADSYPVAELQEEIKKIISDEIV